MTVPQSKAARAPHRNRKTWLGISVAFVLIVAAIVAWTVTCPCDRTPGLVLLGTVHEEPVTDWSFANDVPLCQIQVWTSWGPRAMNLNCMASPDGELFLSCSTGAQKYWCGQVDQDERARLRLDSAVYPVVLSRVLEQTTLDRAWSARVKKLQVHGGGPGNPKPPPDAQRPDSWWSFQVRSEGSR